MVSSTPAALLCGAITSEQGATSFQFRHSSNSGSQFHWELGAYRELGAYPPLTSDQPQLLSCCLLTNMLIFPFHWLCHANPTTQSSSGCEMAWWPSCNLPIWNSPSLCQLSFFLGLGMTRESGLLGLVPKDFPDPYRQKQRRFLCFAFLYNMFIIMLLSFFKRLQSFTGLC